MMLPTNEEIRALMFGWAGALLAIGVAIGVGACFLARFIGNHIHIY